MTNDATSPSFSMELGAATTGPYIIEYCQKCGLLFLKNYTQENHPCAPTAKWRRYARLLRRRSTGKWSNT